MAKSLKYIAFFVLCTACVFLFSQPAQAREVIKLFNASAHIEEDASLVVEEKLLINVENVEINKGIIRSFPVEYESPAGRSVRVGFEVLDTQIDGKSLSWSTSSVGRFKEVRIGDPDKTLAPGLHTFVIKYRTTKQLGFFEDHEELYWNVTGNGWIFPIERASFSLSLPGQGPQSGFNSIEWYVGSYGEKGNKNDAAMTKNGIETMRPLAAGEGISVVYTWPKGVITPPPPPYEGNRTAQTIAAFAMLFCVLGWSFYAWKKWGKDPQMGPVIPLFYPPAGRTPGFLRYALEMNFEKVCFSADVLNLAVKGALFIEEEKGKKYALRRNENFSGSLTDTEDIFYRGIFPGIVSRVSSDKNSEYLERANTTLRNNFSATSDALYTGNLAARLAGLGIILLGLIANYFFSGDTDAAFVENILIIMTIVIFSLFAFWPSKAANSTGRIVFRVILRSIIPFFAAFVLFALLISEDYAPAVFLLYASACWTMIIMQPIMPARTGEGNKLLADTLGLKLYMNTAERGMLEMLFKEDKNRTGGEQKNMIPEDTPQVYENMLPYALALGVADTWGKRFESVLKAAEYKPSWYNGSNYPLFFYGGGLNSFSSTMADIATPSAAPGTFSGSLGGGFSGGGGGGGGGRGW